MLTLLKLTHEDIVFENYEDEMVLLNLPDGVYFTLDPVGADCLLLLLSAVTLEAAFQELSRRYASPPEDIQAGVRLLIQRLTEVGLVMPRSDQEKGIELAPGFDMSGRAYTPPFLERYDDIEDILKFDPVHEVAETGWPNIPDDGPNKG